ncbi:hypothetical protein ACC713_29605 [Rhizobium johnstonii]|uniref:hypothetical protein n=1 Tax=Rhizobium johnstonii TaxID=3019933 RepID=UPI003F9DFE82
MEKRSTVSRDLIAEAIRSVVDELVKEHFDALTQEHQLTSRICQALEGSFRDTMFGKYRVRIVVQEMPDKGPGTLEKKTGVDLYIGIRVDEGVPISKGLFIQSKWKESEGRSAKEQKTLVGQCREITKRTDSGYVWLYGPDGVDVVPAKEVIANPKAAPEALGSRKINEVVRQVLDCFEGDRKYGLPDDLPVRKALVVMMERFAANAAISIDISSRPLVE